METFTLDEQQLKKLYAWIEPRNRIGSNAADGERFMYCFIPTSLGVVCKVKDCVKNEEIDLTDYDKW